MYGQPLSQWRRRPCRVAGLNNDKSGVQFGCHSQASSVLSLNMRGPVSPTAPQAAVSYRGHRGITANQQLPTEAMTEAPTDGEVPRLPRHPDYLGSM